LIHRDIITDFCRFANDAKAMIEEKIASNFRTGVNVDAGHEARKVIDQSR